MTYKVLAVLLVIATSSPAFSDYLEISRNVMARDEPDRNGQVVAKLEQGTQIELLDNGVQENGYYRVWIASKNRDGWVYRNRARRFAGDLPVNSEAATGLVIRSLMSPHCIRGCPLGGREGNDLILRDIYLLSSNPETKFADWVAYVVRSNNLGGESANRNWKTDPWLMSDRTLEPRDYTDANSVLSTDRGHQAPLAAFTNTEQVQETNYLSNITPQKSALNQGPWKHLEDRVRALARDNDVYVLTGPLYERNMQRLPRTQKPHRLPSGYWKIVILQNSDGIEAIAFLMDQTTERNADFLDHLTTVSNIERKTGLDFLWMLADGEEELIENKLDSDRASSIFHPN